MLLGCVHLIGNGFEHPRRENPFEHQVRKDLNQTRCGLLVSMGQLLLQIVVLTLSVRTMSCSLPHPRFRSRKAGKGPEQSAHAEARRRGPHERAQSRDERRAQQRDPKDEAPVRPSAPIDQPSTLDQIGAYVAQSTTAKRGPRKPEAVERVVPSQLPQHRLLKRRKDRRFCVQVDRPDRSRAQP